MTVLHVLADAQVNAATPLVYTVVAILASAVIVLGGLAALVRAIWKVSNIMRDNTQAVQTLTGRFDDMAASTDGRFDKLSQRVYQLESREFGRHPGEAQPGAPDDYEGHGRDHGRGNHGG